MVCPDQPSGKGSTMTTPSQGPLGGLSSRALAAIGLVGYAALFLFFAFIEWIAADLTFTARSDLASGLFLNLVTMAMPIVAVLLAVKVTPALPIARTIVLAALIEYGVSVVLGLITFLIAIGHLFDVNTGLEGTRALIIGLAQIVLIAIGGFITYRIFTEMGGRLTAPGAAYGSYPPPASPTQQLPPQSGSAYPPQPGPYPGAQQ